MDLGVCYKLANVGLAEAMLNEDKDEVLSNQFQSDTTISEEE